MTSTKELKRYPVAQARPKNRLNKLTLESLYRVGITLMSQLVDRPRTNIKRTYLDPVRSWGKDYAHKVFYSAETLSALHERMQYSCAFDQPSLDSYGLTFHEFDALDSGSGYRVMVGTSSANTYVQIDHNGWPIIKFHFGGGCNIFTFKQMGTTPKVLNALKLSSEVLDEFLSECKGDQHPEGVFGSLNNCEEYRKSIKRIFVAAGLTM